MDPLKRCIFPKGVFLHSENITPDWDQTVQRSTQVIADACRSTTLWEQFHFDVIEQSTTSRFCKKYLAPIAGSPRRRRFPERSSEVFLNVGLCGTTTENSAKDFLCHW